MVQVRSRRWLVEDVVQPPKAGSPGWKIAALALAGALPLTVIAILLATGSWGERPGENDYRTGAPVQAGSRAPADTDEDPDEESVTKKAATSEPAPKEGDPHEAVEAPRRVKARRAVKKATRREPRPRFKPSPDAGRTRAGRTAPVKAPVAKTAPETKQPKKPPRRKQPKHIGEGTMPFWEGTKK